MDDLLIVLFCILGVALFITVIVIAVRVSQRSWAKYEEQQITAAGKLGEAYATSVIQNALRDNDFLFTNVNVSFEDKKAEMDNVIVNRNGVFVIEVKFYHGILSGSEDDYEWSKVKLTDAGYLYKKSVKNPVKQVKRQTYILAKHLAESGINVWVEGYAMILGAEPPVDSELILSGSDDVDKVIHRRTKNSLSDNTVARVCRLMET